MTSKSLVYFATKQWYTFPEISNGVVFSRDFESIHGGFKTMVERSTDIEEFSNSGICSGSNSDIFINSKGRRITMDNGQCINST